MTIIHAKIGKRAFGTSPGYAEVMATLRSFKNTDMKLLTDIAIKRVKSIAKKYKLRCKIEFTEEFPATVNEGNCVEIIKKAANKSELKIQKIKTPFRWSEDFGHFTNHQPALHNPHYDFPDEIIEPGVKVFYSIIKQILD